MSGHEVCPKRSPGCSAACLHFAGNPAHQSKKDKARIKRTRLLFEDRNLFMNILVLEIAMHSLRAKRKNKGIAVRLNERSDIVWERREIVMFLEVKTWITRNFPIDDLEQKYQTRMLSTLPLSDNTNTRDHESRAPSH